jgi:hypothetical protein
MLVEMSTRVGAGARMANSVTVPAVVIRPMLFGALNRNAPSGPATMLGAAVGIGNSVIVCAAAARADASSRTVIARAQHRIPVKPTFSDFNSSEGHYLLLSVSGDDFLPKRVSWAG